MIYNKSTFNADWDTSPLNKLGDFWRGKSKHRPRNDPKLFVGGRYPFIQTGDIKASNLYIDSHSSLYNDLGLQQSKLWDSGTLCITIAANIAETGILAYPMCFPDSVVGFVANKNKTSELFMHYVFSYIKKRIQNSAIGSIQDNIDIALLTGLEFKIPKKPIQDKIVELLSAIDLKIALNDKINAAFELIAKTLYNYWFVQFDFLNEEGKPYKTSGGEMEYNEVLKREIPAGWKVENLASSEITQIIDVGIENYSGSKIYLSTAEVENAEIVNHTITETIETKPSRANMQPVFNSVWFARMKDTKKLILVSESSNEIVKNYIFSTGFAGIKVPNYALYYLWNFINDPYFEEMKNKKATGSTQKSIINETISSIPLVIPDKKLLEEFNHKTISLYKNIYKNQRENYELMQIRDFLLPLLMIGQVKVN